MNEKTMLKIEIDLESGPQNCKIFLNDEIIGFVQEFRCKLSVDSPTPEIEFTFPDLKNVQSQLQIDINRHHIALNKINKLFGTNIKTKFVQIEDCYGEQKEETVVINKQSTTPIEEFDFSKFESTQ